jgi:Ca2+-binding RTX toxin-like protein
LETALSLTEQSQTAAPATLSIIVCNEGQRVMRARNGNISYQADRNSENLDFTVLDAFDLGVDYVNLGGNDRVIGTKFDDSFTLSAGVEIIDGRGGSDTVSYVASTAAVNVNLNATVQMGGHAAGDQLKNIENVTGSNHYGDTLTGNGMGNVLSGLSGDDVISGLGGNDTLLGGNGHDTLAGGTGNNHIDGGDGIDTVDYSTSAFDTGVNLSQGIAGELLPGFQSIEHDALGSIENIMGATHDDFFMGNAEANTMYGNGGNDAMFGLEGNDTLYGGMGDDELGTMQREAAGFVFIYDDIGDDKLYGEGGNDKLVGSAGADLMDGGADFDTADYSNSGSSVNIIMSSAGNGTGSGGTAGGDTLVSIEKVVGSTFGDFFSGSAGNDHFVGREGDDRFTGGAGADVLDGGEDIDTVGYLQSAQGVKVNLLAGVGAGGDADGDTLTDIENILASMKNDYLRGSDADNTLLGLAGNDSIGGEGGDDIIEGGDGNDKLYGGADADSFAFRAPASPLTLSSEVGDGHDVILDYEIGVDRLMFAGTDLSQMTIYQSGEDTIINYAGNSSITLVGVEADELLAHTDTDLVFA